MKPLSTMLARCVFVAALALLCNCIVTEEDGESLPDHRYIVHGNMPPAEYEYSGAAPAKNNILLCSVPDLSDFHTTEGALKGKIAEDGSFSAGPIDISEMDYLIITVELGASGPLTIKTTNQKTGREYKVVTIDKSPAGYATYGFNPATRTLFHIVWHSGETTEEWEEITDWDAINAQ